MCTGAEAGAAAAEGGKAAGTVAGETLAAEGATALGAEAVGSSIAGEAVGAGVGAEAVGSGAGALTGGEALATLPETVVTAAPIAAELGAGEVAGAGLAGAGAASALTADTTGGVDVGEAGQFGAGDSGMPQAGGGTGVDVGVDYGGDTVLGNPGEGGLGYNDGVLEKLQKLSQGKSVKDALDKLTKYGPLALGGAGMLQNRAATDRFRQQMAAIGGPQRAVGEQLLQQYQQGQLSPADAGRIAQWEQSALAQAKQYMARAGTRTSTSANATYADIKKQAELLRQQALQGVLTTGLNALNVTDKYQAEALKAELAADTAASQQGMQFMNAYGSWLRAMPQITGEAATPKV